MALKDLKIGMVVVDRFNADLFTIIKVNLDDGDIILQLIGSTSHKNFGGNFIVPCGCFSYNYSIINNLMYDNELHTPSKVNEPHTPSKIYVVSTIIDQGMEFQEKKYTAVFKSYDKAKEYYKSEHFKYYKKLANLYHNEGESVYTDIITTDKECEIYADYNMKDRVIIKLEEKSVQ